jgi:hypothetical protein
MDGNILNIEQSVPGREFDFNVDQEWKPFQIKSREGTTRNILVKN